MADLAITFTPAEVSTYYAARLPALKQSGAEWRGQCPVDRGWNDQFAANQETGNWSCPPRNGGILDLEMALSGGDFATVKADVFRLVGRIEPGNGTNTNGESLCTTPIKPTKPSSEGMPLAQPQAIDLPRMSLHDDLLNHALRYAALGWRIIPLRGKDPITEHGVLV